MVILLVIFGFANFVFAQSDLKNYTEQLLSNFDKEIDTINNFSDAYKKADFQNDFSISLFKSSIKTYKNSFNGYLSFYRTSLSSAPTELKDIVNTAISGTEQIISGLDSINNALNNQGYSQIFATKFIK